MITILWIIVFHINISSIHLGVSLPGLTDCCGLWYPQSADWARSQTGTPQQLMHPPHVTSLPSFS